MAKTRYEREGVELEDPISVMRRQLGKYIHFTSADKLGINTRANYPGANPVGIYGHTITSVLLNALINADYSKFGSSMKSVNLYKNIFIFDYSGETLDLNNLEPEQVWDLAEACQNKGLIEEDDIDEEYMSERDALTGLIAAFKVRNDISSLNLAANILLRTIGGYIAIKGYLSTGDPNEVCVLDPTKVVILDKVNNPLFDPAEHERVERYRSRTAQLASAFYKKAISD